MSSTRTKLSGGVVKKYYKAAEMKKGEIIKGTFVEKFIDNYEKPAYKLREANGDFVVVNGAGNLNKQMLSATTGQLLEIEYSGSTKLPKGHKFAGKPVHNFEVYVISDDSAGDEDFEDSEDEAI